MAMVSARRVRRCVRTWMLSAVGGLALVACCAGDGPGAAPPGTTWTSADADATSSPDGSAVDALPSVDAVPDTAAVPDGTPAQPDGMPAQPDGTPAQPDGAAVSVTLSPPRIVVQTGSSQAFVATVTGTSNTAVSFRLREGAAGGSVSPSGVYTAPATLGYY